MKYKINYLIGNITLSRSKSSVTPSFGSRTNSFMKLLKLWYRSFFSLLKNISDQKWTNMIFKEFLILLDDMKTYCIEEHEH